MIEINEKFKPLFNNKTRYNILTGGRGSAKSFSVSLYLCTLTFEPNQKILFTRYTLTSAKVSIIPEFIEKIELLNVGHHFRITNDSIENITTGSSIIFKGIKTSSGNQTASLKSLQGITVWVLDESEELEDENIFDKIDLSIRTKGITNKVILVLNPTTKEHWIYKRFFEGKGVNAGFNGIKTDTTYIHTNYLDNINNLDDSFIQNIELIKKKSPNKYEHLIMGCWLDKAEGVIFEDVSYGLFDDSLPYVYGMDFGYVTDETTLCKVATTKDKIFVDELLYKKGMSTLDIIQALNSLVSKRDLIIADNAEPRLIAEIRLAGFNIQPCVKGADSIKNGLAKMTNKEIILTESSINAHKEFSNYVWNSKSSNIPIDDFNHCIDGIRYAHDRLVGIKPKAPKIRLNKIS